jgi:hypothetical protein
MPRVRIHNRTQGSTLPNGVALVIRAGVTKDKGVFAGDPNELVAQAGATVNYDVSSSYACRVTAKPKKKGMKEANWVPKGGRLKTDIDLYIIASNDDYVEISYDDPDT